MTGIVPSILFPLHLAQLPPNSARAVRRLHNPLDPLREGEGGVYLPPIPPLS